MENGNADATEQGLSILIRRQNIQKLKFTVHYITISLHVHIFVDCTTTFITQLGHSVRARRKKGRHAEREEEGKKSIFLTFCWRVHDDAISLNTFLQPPNLLTSSRTYATRRMSVQGQYCAQSRTMFEPVLNPIAAYSCHTVYVDKHASNFHVHAITCITLFALNNASPCFFISQSQFCFSA